MPKYGLIACFSWVNKPNIGEYKFDRYGSAKIVRWKMEKKIEVLAFQKVAKTGDFGKKSPAPDYINYLRYLNMQKVKYLR